MRARHRGCRAVLARRVAALGFRRAPGAESRVAWLIGVYGASLIGAAIFEPDPMNGFPTAAASTDATVSGYCTWRSERSAGVLLLWIAVLTSWAWLAWASVRAYRTVPHPDARKRVTT